MPSLPPITDIVIDPDSFLSNILPQATDDDGSVIYAANGLAAWMNFVPSTRTLSGTAPNSSSATTITYTATDAGGVVSTETFDVVVRLGLGDFNTSGLEIETLALFQAGPRDVSAVWARAPRTARGRLLSGEFALNNNIDINELRFLRRIGNAPGGARIAFHDNSDLHLRNFFSANNPGNDLFIRIQTDDTVIGFPVDGNLITGSEDFATFNIPEFFRSTVAGIEQGDRFILAFTRSFLFRRLDSIDDLDFIFERANTTVSDIGSWEIDNIRSTSTGHTGPGENSVGKFAYSDASGVGTEFDIATNSVLTVRPEIMSAWIGIGRQLRFHASIAGRAWVDTGEGLEIQGRVDSTDSWSRIELIEGWPYSDTYLTGDTITDAAGDTLTCVQNGGWVDFSVEIPNDHTEVRIRSMPVAGPQQTYRHDAALRDIELRAGESDTTPTAADVPDQTAVQGVAFSTTLDAGSGGNAPLGHAVNGRPEWLNFDPTTRVLSGTPDAIGSHDLTYVVTDNDGDADSNTFRITVNEAPPARPEVEAVSETSLTATWTAPIASYDIRISVAGQDTWQESSRVTSPFTFSDLEQGTNYEVQVRAVNSVGASLWSLSGRAATHLILEATEIKSGEKLSYRTDWDSNVIYKVANNGKVVLFFNHTNTNGVRLTFKAEQTVEGRGGKALPIGDDIDESEKVEPPIKGAFNPQVYNDKDGNLRFTVSTMADDGMPITGVEIEILRYP